MSFTLKKPELLAPAGNFEKLEIAIHYGADAVYLAGKDFSLRNFSGNFSEEALYRGMALARKNNVKVFLACNIYSRNHEQAALESYMDKIGQIRPDALIISDPGIVMLARERVPDIDIHLSTQTNTTNYNAVRFWERLGIKRVNLARELSLEEIQEITCCAGIETEAFIHGAMCISYSGRCLLSTVLSKRDANRGLCSHPCRWRYAVVEEMRPNEFHPVMEDDRGAYIFNSKDLCMIGHIPELIRSGLTSLKIEGRMKGINYLAAVVKTYREAIDTFMADPAAYALDRAWAEELAQVYHRKYCTGFYFHHPNDTDEEQLNRQNRHQGTIHSFIGKILSCLDRQRHLVEIRNKLSLGDQVDVLTPEGPSKKSAILALTDPQGSPIENAQPNTRAILTLEQQFSTSDIIRKP
jgi:putative protease